MLYQDAVELFGQSVSIDCEDRRFLVSVIDPEIKEDDLLVRIEVSFLETLEELKPGAQGGTFESLKSGRISASVLYDWGVLNEENSRDFLNFCQTWDPNLYYKKGGQRQRALVTQGILEGDIVEFVGPTSSCAGLVRLSLYDGRLSFGGSGGSSKGREFVRNLLKGAAPAKAEVLF